MLAKKESDDQNIIISNLILKGDLSGITPEHKSIYYKQLCDRIGLDAFHQPFKIIRFKDGRESLYCTREGAQQLNRLHSVSHKIVAREQLNGAYVVTAQAYLPDARQTESIGACYIEGLKGNDFCNALMKAETKAKRRSTLDLLGLGLLDETELETIQNIQKIDFEKPKELKQLDRPSNNPLAIRSYPQELETNSNVQIEPKKSIEKPKEELKSDESNKVIEFPSKNQPTKKQLEKFNQLVSASVFSVQEVEQARAYILKASKEGVGKMIDRLLQLIEERNKKPDGIYYPDQQQEPNDVPY